MITPDWLTWSNFFDFVHGTFLVFAVYYIYLTKTVGGKGK